MPESVEKIVAPPQATTAVTAAETQGIPLQVEFKDGVKDSRRTEGAFWQRVALWAKLGLASTPVLSASACGDDGCIEDSRRPEECAINPIDCVNINECEADTDVNSSTGFDSGESEGEATAGDSDGDPTADAGTSGGEMTGSDATGGPETGAETSGNETDAGTDTGIDALPVMDTCIMTPLYGENMDVVASSEKMTVIMSGSNLAKFNVYIEVNGGPKETILSNQAPLDSENIEFDFITPAINDADVTLYVDIDGKMTVQTFFTLNTGSWDGNWVNC